MQLLDIQIMLDEAYSKGFLMAIDFLMDNEKEYMKSEFYKKSKISILKLYETFVVYTQQKYDWIDRLNQMIAALDEGLVESKIQEIILKLKNNDSVKELFKALGEQFDVAKLLEQNKELEEFLKKIKP